MKTLSQQDIKLMESLVAVDQESLQKVLHKFLKRHYKKKKIVNDPDFLLAEGDIPIALVAHMDTVFKQPATELFYDQRKNVMWSPTGMGADDRAGVFSIIKIIEAGFRPHIIFTTDEEIGCVGANELSYHPCPFEDLRFIIQLDRRGADDCVFYDCDNPEFEKYIEGFGFVTNFGSFTDICELCPRWGMAGVNLSIGYRSEHTTSEVLFVGQMLSTIEKVKKILSETNIPNFKYIPSKYSYYNYLHHGWDNFYKDEDFMYNDYPMYPTEEDEWIPTSQDWKEWEYASTKCKCGRCKKYVQEDDYLPVKLIKGGKSFWCTDCLVGHADICSMCNEVFEISGPDDYISGKPICSDCRKKLMV